MMTTHAQSSRRRIQSKLLIAFAAVVIPPLVFVGVYHLHTITRTLEQNAVESASEALFLKARNIEQFLKDCKLNLRHLSQTSALKELVDALDGPEERIRPLRRKVEYEFLSFSQSQGIYAGIGFIDLTGEELVRVDSEGIVDHDSLHNRRDREYFIETMKLMPNNVSVRITRQNPDDGSPQRDPVLWYAMPVVNRRLQKRGVVLTTIFGRHLFTLPQEGEADVGETFLMNREGLYLSHPDRSKEWGGPNYATASENVLRDYGPEIAKSILSGTRGVITEGSDDLISYARVSLKEGDPTSFWVLADPRPKRMVFARVRAYRRVFVIILVGSLMLALSLSVFLARRFTRPLTRLRDGVRSFGGGNLAYRVDVHTNDEIEDLADEFNRMADTLETFYTGLEEKIEEKTKELERANARLIQSEKLAAIGTLSSGVAHEINNPLDGLLNCIARIRKKPEDVERTRTYLDMMSNALSRIASVVQQLLDFSRKHELTLRATDVHRVLEDAILLMDYRLGKSNVQIVRDFAHDLPRVTGDGHHLQQVFLNLTLNALDAMPDGGTLHLRSYPSDHPASAPDVAPDRICVEIEDTGVGIPEGEIDKIFDPFYTTKGPGEGTGLGLSVSYSIVKEHSGEIEVRSVEGQGTTFIVRLPVA